MPELEGLGDLEGLTGPQQVVQSGLQDPPVQVPFVGSLGEVHKIERAGPAEKRNYEELRPNREGEGIILGTGSPPPTTETGLRGADFGPPTVLQIFVPFHVRYSLYCRRPGRTMPAPRAGPPPRTDARIRDACAQALHCTLTGTPITQLLVVQAIRYDRLVPPCFARDPTSPRGLSRVPRASPHNPHKSSYYLCRQLCRAELSHCTYPGRSRGCH